MIERKPHGPGRGQGRRRGRARQGATASRAARSPALWLYGVHAVLAALDNPRRRAHRLLLTAEAAREHATRLDAAARARPDLPAPEPVARGQLARLLPPGAVHQGIAARVAPLPEADLGEVCAAAGPDALLVVLDRVSDPHNVGAVLRSAAAFGAAALVLPRDHAPPVTGALAKAASGALEVVPLIPVTNLARTLDRLKEAGFWCLGLDAAASESLAAAATEGRAALVLGAEGAGLRRLTRERCDMLVRLPTRAPFSSLNVSNAAAIALYELARTRGR